MLTWNTIAVMATAFAAVGMTFDKLMLHRHKRSLFLLLLSCWNKLDDTDYRNLAKQFSSFALRQYRRMFPGTLFSLRALIIWTILSWLLTSTAALIGAIIDPGIFEQTSLPLPFFPVYVANWFFDIVAIAVLLKVLRMIQIYSPTVGLFAISGNLLFAMCLVIACLSTSNFLLDLGYNYNWIGGGDYKSYIETQVKRYKGDLIQLEGFTENDVHFKGREGIRPYLENAVSYYIYAWKGQDYPKRIKYVFQLGEGNRARTIELFGNSYQHFWSYLLIPTTVFLPTAMFLFFLAMLLVSKIILDLYKGVTLHFLELAGR